MTREHYVEDLVQYSCVINSLNGVCICQYNVIHWTPDKTYIYLEAEPRSYEQPSIYTQDSELNPTFDFNSWSSLEIPSQPNSDLDSGLMSWVESRGYVLGWVSVSDTEQGQSYT